MFSIIFHSARIFDILLPRNRPVLFIRRELQIIARVHTLYLRFRCVYRPIRKLPEIHGCDFVGAEPRSNVISDSTARTIEMYVVDNGLTAHKHHCVRCLYT